MQTQKIKIWKKIALSFVGVITALTMTFASNFLIEDRPNVAYALDCYDKDGKESTQTGPDCPSGMVKDKKDIPSDPGKMSSADKEELNKIVLKFLVFERWLNSFMWPVFIMIGGLINNELIFSNGMDQRLYDIWVQIRNLVNIVFVMVLVGIALYSVLGINSESSQYSIKTMLPRLIIGIIAVNFSFLGVKVILDATTVVTTAIFAIPNQTLGTLQNMTVVDPDDLNTVNELCKKVYNVKTAEAFDTKINDLILTTFAGTKGIDTTQNKADIQKAVDDKYSADYGEYKKTYADSSKSNALCRTKGETELELTEYGENFLGQFRSNNAALAMAINMGRILFSDKSSTLTSSSDYMQIAINIIFSFALNAIYLFSFLTLFLVLIARLAVIWISLAFSPVIALGLSMPGIGDKVEMFKKIQDSFVKHVTAPITIAISMTIGWVMLSSLNGMSTSQDAGTTMGMMIPGIPLPGLETIQALIAAIATAAIVWLGATSAAEGTLVSGVVEGLGGQIKSFGKFLGKAPFMYAPIFPVQIKGDDGMRNATLSEAIGGTEDFIAHMKAKERKGQQEFGKQIWNIPDGMTTERDITKESDPATLAGLLATSTNFKTPEDYKRIEKLLRDNRNGKMEVTLKQWKDSEPVGSAKKVFADIAHQVMTDPNQHIGADQAKKLKEEGAKISSASTPTTPATPAAPATGTPAAGTPAPAAPAPVPTDKAITAAGGDTANKTEATTKTIITALQETSTAIMNASDETTRVTKAAEALKGVAQNKREGALDELLKDATLKTKVGDVADFKTKVIAAASAPASGTPAP